MLMGRETFPTTVEDEEGGLCPVLPTGQAKSFECFNNAYTTLRKGYRDPRRNCRELCGSIDQPEIFGEVKKADDESARMVAPITGP